MGRTVDRCDACVWSLSRKLCHRVHEDDVILSGDEERHWDDHNLDEGREDEYLCDQHLLDLSGLQSFTRSFFCRGWCASSRIP